MIEKMRAKPGKSYFFAVGAAHLLTRETGVIDRLRDAGFKLRRLEASDADTELLAKLPSGTPRSTLGFVAEYFR